MIRTRHILSWIDLSWIDRTSFSTIAVYADLRRIKDDLAGEAGHIR